MSYPVPLNQAQADVLQEVERQERLKAEGRFKYTPKDKMPNELKLAMLTEEIGEVARDVLALKGIVQETSDIRHLRKELIQVAAVALAWVEGIGSTEVII